MNSKCEFSHSIREALSRDKKLVRLLGGTNIFEGYDTEISSPHINICETDTWRDCSVLKPDHDATVTLHVWSHSGEKSRAHELIEAAERALAKAGLLEPGSRILLHRDYAGARKLPEIGEFQGILRYHAEHHSDAA